MAGGGPSAEDVRDPVDHLVARPPLMLKERP
jgi:hypothetical protein